MSGSKVRLRHSLLLLLAGLPQLSAANAVEFTGRASLFGSAARAGAGDAGNTGTGDQTLTSDQQSLRLMLDESQEQTEWFVHIKTARQHLNGVPIGTGHPSQLFRYRDFSGNWQEDIGATSSTRIGYELDRASYKRRFGPVSVSLGRQPVDWGSGRFWQPLNVFGAFAPTDLDTDFKPGIDAAVFDWFPSVFSSMTAVYALAPKDNPSIEDSAAIHYRRQVGERSEIALLTGKVIGNEVIGASFESDLAGLGWRIEGARHRFRNSNQTSNFWVAGVDYQFSNGTLVSAEWHDNSRGASSASALPAMVADPLVINGLQPQLGRRVLGVSATKDVTPLLNASYKLFVSALKDDVGGGNSTSLLHQLSFVYSVSNESDLLLALLYATGKGLNAQGAPQSEFGHQPPSITVRWRVYF